MSIKLIFESNLKNIIGKHELDYPSFNISIIEILTFLFEYCSKNNRIDLLKSFANDKEDFFSKVLILINDIVISTEDWKSINIKNEDIVVFLPITHGG
ncbi:MAG: hypothetical protein ACTSPY_06870 [Candidatus Helarchaeota archaeon]